MIILKDGDDDDDDKAHLYTFKFNGEWRTRMSKANIKKGKKLRHGIEVSNFLPKQLFVLARPCDRRHHHSCCQLALLVAPQILHFPSLSKPPCIGIADSIFLLPCFYFHPYFSIFTLYYCQFSFQTSLVLIFMTKNNTTFVVSGVLMLSL